MKSVPPSTKTRKAPAAKTRRTTKARRPAVAAPKAVTVEETHDHVVVFVRHGIAEDHSPDIPDANRSLTPVGHAEMKKITKGLAVLFPKTDAIFSSPLLRAVETALRVGRRYKGYSAVETSNTLLPEADPESTIELIRSIAGKRAILVGHEPHLSATLHALTGVSFTFRKGGCVCVRIPARGSAELEWILAPGLLARIRS